jgi:hypothetical protein
MYQSDEVMAVQFKAIHFITPPMSGLLATYPAMI